MVRVFANAKDSKMLLHASLLKTKHYIVQNKGKWGNTRKELVLFRYLGVVHIKKGNLRSPLTTVGQLTYM